MVSSIEYQFFLKIPLKSQSEDCGLIDDTLLENTIVLIVVTKRILPVSFVLPLTKMTSYEILLNIISRRERWFRKTRT